MSQPKTFEDFRDAPVWMVHDATKAPRNPRTGGFAKANDPSTWAMRAEAEAFIADNDNLTGLGIALGPASVGDGDALYAIDLDGCRDPDTGAIAAHAREIVERFDSYTEISPSGTGLKIFAIAEAGHSTQVFSPGKGREVKLMSEGTYSTVTGQQTDTSGTDPASLKLIGNPSPIRTIERATLEWLTHKAGPAYKSGQSPLSANQRDESRSAYAIAMAKDFKRRGKTREEFETAIAADTGPAGDKWNDPSTTDREKQRTWDRANFGAEPFTFPNLDDIASMQSGEPSSGLKLTPFKECSARSGERYLVKGLIAPGDLGAIIGPPGAGKSVIGPLLGFRLANGQRFFGSKVRQAKVFYVAAEDPTGMERRLVGLRETHSGDQGPTLVTGIHDLTNEAQLRSLADAIKAERPGLVIIDTLADSFPGLDENAAESMAYVVKASRALTRLGPAVILVHHTTKANDGTPRGHSVFNGALDMSLLLKGADASGIVRGQLRKNRNGPCDLNIAFRIVSAHVGEDSDGDAITAACGEEVTSAGIESPKLPPSELAAMNHFTQLLAECAPMSGGPSVLIADWREACVNSRDVSATENADSRRKAFDRALANLSRKGLVHTSGELCSRPQQSLFSGLGDIGDE